MAFTKDPIFGVELIDRIHKRVQVSRKPCNTTSIKEVKLGALAQFGGLQKKVEIGIGRPSHTKGVRATQVRQTWDHI